MAATKTAMRALETRKVAEIKKQAVISERQAVAKAVAKERFEQEAKRAALVASAVASAKAKIEAEKKSAVKQAVAREKAKARVGRVATAVPFFGILVAAGFEYAGFQEWKQENPDGELASYAKQSGEEMLLFADEVVENLPEWARVDVEKLLSRYNKIIRRVENESKTEE